MRLITISEIFFARYYKFYRYEKTISEEDARVDSLPENYSIRELDPENDYEKFKSAWQKIYSNILPEPYVKFEKNILLNYPKTFILEDPNANIIGFIVCHIKQDEKPNGEKMGKILRIGVEKKYRRHGFGELLYRRACQYYLSKGINQVYFDVYERDKSLSKVVSSSLGFKKTKEFFITIDDPVENFITLETIMSL
ncbi:MAG: GNAT family N-acetyltransferase [Candidatus Lokiarchaeota archaeon]|nr:GNAT family N-acetyltransferase [Candidatus Lokiarchaeota archaeon]